MTEATDVAPASRMASLRDRVPPIVVLVILATVIAELLFGSTTLSLLGAVAVEMPLYGAGALLIRELVRRNGGGWPSLVLCGVAYGAVEEGLLEPNWFTLQALQAHPYGVALGVDWPYAVFNAGYHAIWSVTLPILVVELLFPARRHEPWLGRVGIGVAALVYVATAAVTWVMWRSLLAPKILHLPPAPPSLLAAAAVLAVLLVLVGAAACRPWHARRETVEVAPGSREAPAPWLVGIAALLAGLAWFVWFFVPDRILKVWLPLPGLLLIDAAIVVVCAVVLMRWSRRRGWGRWQLFALYAGALVAHMIGGLKIYTYQLTGANLVFTVSVNVVALVLLALYPVLWTRRHRSVE